MSKEEFLNFAEFLDGNVEFDNGKLIEMSKGTDTHSLIKGDTLMALKAASRVAGTKCFVYNSDLAINIPLFGKVVYPDMCIVENLPEYAITGRKDIISNPLVVVEVLSDSTKNYDKGTKFDLYCSLPSFREYILIDQHSFEVQKRLLIDADNNLWKYTNYKGLEVEIPIESLGISVKMADIYFDAAGFIP
jgi:Uma2 family endonuclease